MGKVNCYHCGDPCEDIVVYDDKEFCCFGCKTVYEIISQNDLENYYCLEKTPGISPELIAHKFDYLKNEEIAEGLLSFDDDNTSVVELFVPVIHCSSCIWILENLGKIQSGIIHSSVNFTKKIVTITFNKRVSLYEIVQLLARLGYEPNLSLEDETKEQKKIDRSLIYKLGIAGFAFGNIMFLSFPEYFDPNEYWLEKYKGLFRFAMFIFSLPVVFYAGRDYFVSAYKGLRSGFLNIDVPIALGISVLFIRSTVEIFLDLGSGFFDSLSGLVFFLLLGKFIQQRTYAFLSFERDYKSYFPLAVSRLVDENEEDIVAVGDVEKGDVILVRDHEIIPVDGTIIEGEASIDYSFVTGESLPIARTKGERVFAGGRQLQGIITIIADKTIKNSQIAKLWERDAFQDKWENDRIRISDLISRRFTVILIVIALLATGYWLVIDSSKALNVFTAVLIIACPCAIALSAPFALGNMLRILGKKKCYLKNTATIEKMASIDAFLFDKTGTMTMNKNPEINWHGDSLEDEMLSQLKSIFKLSNHPLSRMIYSHLGTKASHSSVTFTEYPGKGFDAIIGKGHYRVGSAKFLDISLSKEELSTRVYVQRNDSVLGYFCIQKTMRTGLKELFDQLRQWGKVVISSGDNEGEKAKIAQYLPEDTVYNFDQSPENKLETVATMKSQGKTVMMVGDGLNDAGALAEADVGIAVSENINVFSPASDGIIDADKLLHLGSYISASKRTLNIIKISYIISIIYNIIGLYFAVTGQLSPVIAAILMPLSSITIVVFTTIATNVVGRQIV